MFWTAVYNILRSLFFSLDKIVYDLIGNVYGLLLQICRTSVFDTDAIHSFSSRIYVFIGLFMLFKLSVSLITYLLNPDDFSKGEKSFATIVKNAILALVMVVLCPYVFTELFEVQSIILEENTIMNIAFGTPNDSSANIERISNATYADSAGEKIKFTLAFTFAQPNYEEFSHSDVADLIDCKYTYQKDGNNNFKFRKRAKFGDSEAKDSGYIYSLDPSCWGVYDPDSDTYVDDGINGQLIKAFDATEVRDAYQDYAQGVAQQSYSLFFKKEAIVQARTQNGKYVINYKFGVSTIIGVITLYLLLMFCIDLAVRSIKLGFLQMIAPIPILSYVDPKAGKDGMFSKWFKACKNTYLDLFIRLFALYFGIYVITLIGKFRDVVTGEIVDGWIVNLFMTLGVLIFVKKLPEFLKETLGFEGAGTFKGYMNPLKKIEDEAFLGKNITGAAAGIAGGTVGALTGAGLLRGVGAGLGGAFAGKGFTETWKNTKDKNSKYRTANLVDRNPFRRTFNRATTGISDAIGTGGHLSQIERREATLNREIDGYKAAKEEIDARIAPIETQISRRKDTVDKIKAIQDRAVTKVKQGKGRAGGVYQTFLRNAEGLKSSTASSGTISINGNTYRWSNDQQRGALAAQLEQEAETYANSTGRDSYIDQAIRDRTLDGALNNLREEYATSARVNGERAEETATGMDAHSINLNNANTASSGRIAADRKEIQTLDDNIKEASDRLRDVTDEKKRYESYRIK